MNEVLEYDDDYLNLCLERAFANPLIYRVPRGITRYDYGHTHCWWLRMRRDNTPFHEHFFDGPCGGIEGALRQAILRRHEILGFPMTRKIIAVSSLSADPEERIDRISTAGNKQPYNAWIAKYYDKNHKVKRQSFSVLKYGEEEAKMLAIEFTKKHHNKKPKLTKIPDTYKKDKYRDYSREEVQIYSTINSGTSAKGGAGKSISTQTDPHGFEGDRRFVLHLQIERDRKLRQAKLEDFLRANGRLFCELCMFSFIEKFPFLNVDIIEIHHLTPLGTLKKGQITKLSDLMLLCSNCHFVIHQGDATENLAKMRNCLPSNAR